MTRYGFQQALGAFFLAETDAVRALLPASLPPLEARPGHAVLAITAFDFTESEVGAYGELVISVLVSPFAPRGSELPVAATFPVILCTTSAASRAHAAERWALPEHDRTLMIRFESDAQTRRVVVEDDGAPVLTLSVERRQATPCVRLYQCFSSRAGQVHRVNLNIEGSLDEHEEESGRLILHDHPLAARIAGMIADDVPLREQSMGAGEQRFEALLPHGSAR